MSDYTGATTLKTKRSGTSTASPDKSKFLSNMPNFEATPMEEIPTAFQELAEKTITQAKQSYDQAKTAAEKMTQIMEDAYSTASKGYTDYGFKLIEVTRANSNAAFDFFNELVAAKSYSEVIEKNGAYMRIQFNTLLKQSKELSEQAQKIYANTVTPIRDSFSSFTNRT
jgi:phasin